MILNEVRIERMSFNEDMTNGDAWWLEGENHPNTST